MKAKSMFLLVLGIGMFLGLRVHGQSASAEAAQAPSKSEMPPALQNMQGSPGYDKEHQKWVDSQNQDPKQAQAKAQADVKRLQSATWTAPAATEKPKPSSEGTPYHNYKGITDPVAAKRAWDQDQKSNTK